MSRNVNRRPPCSMPCLHQYGGTLIATMVAPRRVELADRGCTMILKGFRLTERRGILCRWASC